MPRNTLKIILPTFAFQPTSFHELSIRFSISFVPCNRRYVKRLNATATPTASAIPPDRANARVLAFARSGGIALAVGVAVAFSLLTYLRLHGTKLIENRIESSWKLVGWKAKVGKII